MTDPIKHIVLLMLENHSFDQMLGCFKEKYPNLDGIDPNRPPNVNLDEAGKPYSQKPTEERQMRVDPMHEVNDVSKQLAQNNGGFVKDLVSSYPGASLELQKEYVMGYYRRGFLPALHSLAEDFTICYKWFASVPGPTWTNRFFAWSGTSNGIVGMPEGLNDPNLIEFFQQDQDTIFDTLNERSISWKVYANDFPLSWVLTHQRKPENLKRYAPMRQFHADVMGPADKFPQFSLIEPRYSGEEENDDHPPHDVMRAQKLIAEVYNSIRGREDLWKSTLLVVLYDEHGGFYDHVPPPRAVAPDDRTKYFTFTQLGVRVPALLVSPWVSRACCSTQFDHTSLLRYLADKWSLRKLGRRTEAANSISAAIQSFAAPREDTVKFIKLTADQENPPNREIDVEAAAYFSKHHGALAALVHEIGKEVDLELPSASAPVGEVLEIAAAGFQKLLNL